MAEQAGRTIDTLHHSMHEKCKVMLDNSGRSAGVVLFLLKYFLVTVYDINHADK